MATILGLRDVADFASDERPKDWRETILRMYPQSKQQAPLNALIAGMAKEPTDDPEYNWFEKSLAVRQDAINYSTGYGTTDTTLVVDSSAPFRANDLVLNVTTDEVMKMASDPSAADEIVVSRGWGSTAAAITDDDVLVIVGNAIEEGADPPSSLYTDPTKVYNYTQIFRTSLNVTETAQATKLRTGDVYKNMKKEALDIHTVDMERAFIFGVRNEDLTGSEPRRSTGGILSFLSTNVTPVSDGNLTGPVWDAFLRDLFKYDVRDKLCLCGNQVLLVLQQMAESRYNVQLKVGAKYAGLQLIKWVTPFGVVYFKNHPLFNEITVHSKMALFLTLPHIKYRPLRGRDTKFKRDRQARGADKKTDEFITEAGLEVQHEKTHGVMTNINAYSSS